ncbi:MAG: 3-hydroxybutyryl-CoA dehydrogenase [Calditrichaceae bacterium]|nr:3-hydroxyacyl-CoA dehydrogenase NAD-binding domain-containing protein [Calditrichia bacterium]NUQ42343.1 3-hydroxybutyryl-CoA dehydrogenase [Calditrichaceae bacterium]
MQLFDKTTPIAVIGAGAMGSGIAQVAAAHGHRVVVVDTQSAALENARKNLEKALNRLAEKGSISPENAAEILQRIRFTTEKSACAGCGLAIEAIIENLSAKQAVFRELETLAGEDCILASNTSSLSITAIAAACRKPERVLGAHFFNPAPLMPLVEIIPGIATANSVVETSRRLVDAWGKTTVLAKDTPGFIVNRVARPFYGEAIRIFEEGIADAATIDWAMKEIGGFRMGPFELMDLIGNDVNYAVTAAVWEAFFYDPRYKPSFTQKRLVEAGRLGRKSGKGYYDYAPGALPPEPVKSRESGEEIFFRILAMLINEAAEAVFWQIASVEDIDLAMTKGVNYPKGLLLWADEIGLDKVLEKMRRLQDEYGEDRYRPGMLLKRMAREGRRFYQ